jgi:4-diphosphocytidyl-2-C-methyl-D-erythritol kinase
LTRSVEAPAKLNLELIVLGPRQDGTHEVATVLQAISLKDLLSITPAPETTLLIDGRFPVPVGPDNLVLKAAAAISLTAEFSLTKSIPPGAGLGGGSSDAAAVLRSTSLPASRLAPIAAALGADVPFFLRGGRARATGRGEVLEPMAVEEGWYALAWPGYEVSTAAVYRAWDEVGGEGRNQLFKAACAVEPRLAGFATELGEGWVMTGSGAAFFREAGSEAEARAMVAGKQCWTAVASTLDAWAD